MACGLQDPDLTRLRQGAEAPRPLTIRFDPAMTWGIAPTRTRGLQRDVDHAAIRSCLTTKVLFGMVLRQTTGFAESRLRLVGPGRTATGFRFLSRRRKTLNVDLPDRGADGPPHLLVDSTGTKVKGAGTAGKQGGSKRRVWSNTPFGTEDPWKSVPPGFPIAT